MRFFIERTASAAPSDSIPQSAINGSELAVAGRLSTGNWVGTDAVTGNSAGGGVTTTASSTCSPVGWIAMIGACFNCTTTGWSTVVIGAATSTGSSRGVKSTGVLVAAAISIALAFG